MLRIAYEGGEAEILTAILACAYSYELIAKKIVRDAPGSADDEFYGGWIREYASEKYAAENRILIDTLHRLTEGYTEKQKAYLAEIFINCSRYELKFWDMSWNMRQ